MLSPPKIRQFLFDASIPLDNRAMDVYRYQLEHVEIYGRFASSFPSVNKPLSLSELPYLPLDFFRTTSVLSRESVSSTLFTSSGTTGSATSNHHVADIDLYEESIRKGFEAFYGAPQDYVFFALLPSYLDRKESSLVHMFDYLRRLSGSPDGGFYRYDYDRLIGDIRSYSGSRKLFLIGVSFALWDLAEKYQDLDLSNCVVMETGGMKGKRKEITRRELHEILCPAFNQKAIHSEYGMTELLSQAYSDGRGRFKCPPWVKVLVRDPYDPLSVSEIGKGNLNIVDLANLYSCSFLATQDVGEVFEDGSFTVEGRIDNSVLRGCNLMYAP